MNTNLPLFAQWTWLGLASLAFLGGAASLCLFVFRTLPMMREMRDIARESISLAVTGKTLNGRPAWRPDEMERIAKALEERLPEGGPLRRKGTNGAGLPEASPDVRSRR
jgi:hypothetical protein